MARLRPLAHVHQLRGLDLAVAAAVHLAAHVTLELAPDAVALGVPEHAAVRLFLQVEQVHLAPQLAVVALGRFLQARKVRVELLLVEPASAVDAGELRIVLVAAPIGPGDAHQLEGIGIELAGRGQVRPAAHVEPVVAAPIDGEFLALGQFLGPFGLEGLPLVRPLGDQVFAAPHFAAQRLVRADQAAHFLLDRGKIVHRERLARVGGLHVVIEAVVGRRAEGDLGPGEQRLHRFGKDMRVIVAGEFERIGFVAAGDQREARIAIEGAGEVAQLAVDARGDRGFRKAGADRGGDIGRGAAARHFAHRAIGQADLEQFGHDNRRSVWFAARPATKGKAPEERCCAKAEPGRTPRRPDPGGGSLASARTPPPPDGSPGGGGCREGGKQHGNGASHRARAAASHAKVKIAMESLLDMMAVRCVKRPCQ